MQISVPFLFPLQVLKKYVPLCVVLLGLLWCVAVQAQYAVQTVPNPKHQAIDNYVSDPDGNLSSSTRAQLNAISAGIERANDSEFAIVVVNDYVGDSDFTFALDLFNHWGIGKQGSNNGLLLFLSMDRREYRFISGYGVEGIFPDALLKQIGESYLVPYLQAGNTDMAVLATAKAVESVFVSPDHELELAGLKAYQPTFWNRHVEAFEQAGAVLLLFAVGFGWMSWARRRVLKQYAIKAPRYRGHAFWYAVAALFFLLFISLFVFILLDRLEQVYQLRNLPWFIAVFGMLLLLFHYYGCAQFLAKSTKDGKTSLDMRVAFTRLSLLPLLLSPLAYKAYFDLRKHGRNARLRALPPELPGHWVRISRDGLKQGTLKKYLIDVQIKEEKLGAKAYEIWREQESDDIHISEFEGERIADYGLCPKCRGQTLKKPEVKVRKRATHSQTGTGERMQTCAYCDYQVSLGMVVLAKLQDSSSSSSSGSGSGGGSSGGSFGGGSSGGGGAGGRW